MKHLLLPLLFALPLSVQADEAKCKLLEMGSASLSFTTPSMQVTIPGYINGVQHPLLFDTGAARSIIFKSHARRLQLPTEMSQQYMSGIGGDARVELTRLSEFAVAKSRPSKNSYYRVLDDFGRATSLVGIVGRDWMFQGDMELDLGKRQVKFYAPRDCAKAHLAYWDPDAVVLPLEGDEFSKSPIIEIEINGQKVRALIDSGATNTVLDLRAGARAGLTPGMAGARAAGMSSGIGEERIANTLVPVKQIKIGHEVLEDVRINLSTLNVGSGDARFDMLLGADFLRAHRVLFSISQGKVYISYVGGEPFATDPELRSRFFRAEADAGNPDAVLAFGLSQFRAAKTPEQRAAARERIRYAAEHGLPAAQQQLGLIHYLERDFAKASQQLGAYLRYQPADANAAMLQAVALARQGQRDAAGQQLEASRKLLGDSTWPQPLLAHLQGALPLEAVRTAAALDPALSAARLCLTELFSAEWQRAVQPNEAARQRYQAAHTLCRSGGFEQQVAEAELKQP